MDIKRLSLWLDRIIRFVLGTLFIVAGAMKLRDPEAFVVVIDAFGLVPGSVTGPLSLILPVLEITAGLGLIVDFPLSLHTVSLLLVMFIAILLYGMHLGLDIDCGCYGPDDVEARAFGGLSRAFYRDLWMAAGLCLLYMRRIYAMFFDKKIIYNLDSQKELV